MKIEVSAESPRLRNTVSFSVRSAAGSRIVEDRTEPPTACVRSSRYRRNCIRPASVFASMPFRSMSCRANCSRSLLPGATNRRREIVDTRSKRAKALGGARDQRREVAVRGPRRARERRAEEQEVDDRVLIPGFDARADRGIAPRHPLGPQRFDLSGHASAQFRGNKIGAKGFEDRLDVGVRDVRRGRLASRHNGRHDQE